jgi:hypothetical protein
MSCVEADGTADHGYVKRPASSSRAQVGADDVIDLRERAIDEAAVSSIPVTAMGLLTLLRIEAPGRS